jgi:Mg2+ and Co2+ transporter CorA
MPGCGRLIPSGFQRKSDGGAHIGGTTDVNTLAVGLYNMFADGQTETGTPFIAASCGVCPVKAFEDAHQVLFLDADTVVASLNDYETHLTDKIHFLLDATLGLTNVEQNNIFRILTVVSVVGIPPTFVASMYGMNFKNIPEYDWSYGYQYGLLLIALSALIPIIWFKWRGWW